MRNGQMWSRTGLLRALVVVALSGLALFAGAGSASAHNVVISVDPPRDAQIDSGPAQVTLTFNLPVQREFAAVAVVGPDGKYFEQGPATVSGKTVSTSVRPLGPEGKYTIVYRIVSDDGHPVNGRSSFFLTTAGPGEGTDDPATDGESDDSGAPVWPWVVGVVALVGAGVVGAYRFGRVKT